MDDYNITSVPTGNVSEAINISAYEDDDNDDWYIGPKDYTPWQMYLSWGIVVPIAAATAITSLLVMASILRYKETRSTSFNMYLLGLLFPDAFFGVNCALTCFLSILEGRFHSLGGCHWQAFYVQFYIISNMWCNCVTASEILTMLRYSHQRKRYFPPSRGKVALQVFGVYAFATVIPLLRTYVPFFHNDVQNNYTGCGVKSDGTVNGNVAEVLMYWILGMAVPFLYMCYICGAVYVRNLLPPSGKSRYLAFYFLRVGVVFVVFNAALIAGFFPQQLGVITLLVAAVWTHFQGLVTFIFVLGKNDVKRAVKSFLCCRREIEEMVIQSSKKGGSTEPTFVSSAPDHSNLSSITQRDFESVQHAVSEAIENEQV